MTYQTLRFQVDDSVAHITLDRPDEANSLNLEMARELFEVAVRCDEEPEIRAAVITGAGPMFCGGGDLKSFAAEGDGLAMHLKEVTAYLHAAITRFSSMDAPLVAAVNGAAAGAGFSIALAADIIVAASAARFVMAYTGAGLTPDGSSTYFLVRAVGLHRAKELALTNRVLAPEEALDWGIVSRVVADSELLEAAGALAAELAQGPTLALGEAKRLLTEGTVTGLETQMERETRAIARAAATADGREGVAAFLEKRSPRFTGS